jgi:L-ribulose-5-phosphate 3-epimerase
VQVYFDVANSHEMGYDIYAEMRHLGRARVCEIHAKENGALLGRGDIDFRAVRAALDDIGYAGWLQIEGSIPKGTPMIEAYTENARFMRALFGV